MFHISDLIFFLRNKHGWMDGVCFLKFITPDYGDCRMNVDSFTAFLTLFVDAGCEYGNQYSWCDDMPKVFCKQYESFCCKTCRV